MIKHEQWYWQEIGTSQRSQRSWTPPWNSPSIVMSTRHTCCNSLWRPVPISTQLSTALIGPGNRILLLLSNNRYCCLHHARRLAEEILSVATERSFKLLKNVHEDRRFETQADEHSIPKKRWVEVDSWLVRLEQIADGLPCRSLVMHFICTPWRKS